MTEGYSATNIVGLLDRNMRCGRQTTEGLDFPSSVFLSSVYSGVMRTRDCQAPRKAGLQ